MQGLLDEVAVPVAEFLEVPDGELVDIGRFKPLVGEEPVHRHDPPGQELAPVRDVAEIGKGDDDLFPDPHDLLHDVFGPLGVLDGLVQAGGLAMFIAGFAAPRHQLVRNRYSSVFLPMPMVFGNGGAGVGISGTM